MASKPQPAGNTAELHLVMKDNAVFRGEPHSIHVAPHERLTLQAILDGLQQMTHDRVITELVSYELSPDVMVVGYKKRGCVNLALVVRPPQTATK